MIQARVSTTYLILSILALSILTGCALKQRIYIPPASGDEAHFRVLSASGAAFQGPVATFSDAQTCKGRYFIQRQLDVTSFFTPIPAGRPFSAAFHQSISGSISTGFTFCVPIITFTPVAGRSYTATLAIVKDGCSMSLDVTESLQNQTRRPEPFIMKKFSNGFDENSSFCSSKD